MTEENYKELHKEMTEKHHDFVYLCIIFTYYRL